MTGGPIGSSALRFERRAERAEALAPRAAAAREVLSFAARLLREQGRMAALLAAQSGLAGRLADDAPHVLDAGAGVLRFARGSGLEGLRNARLDAAALVSYWSGESDDYVARALLRPYFELLAHRRVAPAPRPRSAGCGSCGGPPWLGLRRPAAEGDGAARFLVCAWCGAETSIGRVQCAACPEEDPVRLPSFSAESHPDARIEACESCRSYVKTLETSRDPEAVPEVDELLSLSLDLWAQGQGFRRLEPGLAGALVAPG